MSYGRVNVVLRNRQTKSAELLDFCTIPVPNTNRKGDKDPEIRVFIYGILETEDGEFVARPLHEFKRSV